MNGMHEQYTIGQLIPIIIGFIFAYGIARAVAYFGWVTKNNMNRWALFFASVTGTGYVILFDFKPTNDFIAIAGPFAAAGVVGFVSWLFFWCAFVGVAKDDV